ncbi:hypothetical protein LCGC14_2734970 [marine sediment metagenome]|uniref:Uncharacterized protein n=1 Tax=marine sediment metagenome TaxID=412755 RepID=A0A0F9BXR4_9ZZZZ
MSMKTLSKGDIIKTGACYQVNLEFCNNNYDNCILVKKSKEQKDLKEWL